MIPIHLVQWIHSFYHTEQAPQKNWNYYTIFNLSMNGDKLKHATLFAIRAITWKPLVNGSSLYLQTLHLWEMNCVNDGQLPNLVTSFAVLCHNSRSILLKASHTKTSTRWNFSLPQNSLDLRFASHHVIDDVMASDSVCSTLTKRS